MDSGSGGAVTTADVVVVGAGASGVLAAAALLRARCSTVLVERDPSWSTGVAYSTRDPQHLLNVPAGKLSAESEHASDFMDWATGRGCGVSAHSFLPRQLYGEYLRHSLAATVRAVHPVPLTKVSGEVIRIDGGCVKRGRLGPLRVELRGGRTVLAAHVVLALGNPPSRALARGVDNVIDDPWSVGSSAQIQPGDDVVIVGTGLTAIDVALTLFGNGHRKPIRMVSRHGLLPRVHDPRGSRPLAVTGIPSEPTARALIAWIRAAIVETDGDWRAVFDALRPHSNDIWRRVPEAERARLLRHAARYWEVHRHRVAPQVGRAVDSLVDSGRLVVSAGSVSRVCRGTRDACRVEVRGAGTVESALETRWVVNCTGPNFDLRDSSAPLIRRLLRSGAARPGSLGQGLDVTCTGALVDRAGHASQRVSVVGPLRRGAEWETTAIPEIRAQAEAVAVEVARATTPGRVPDGSHSHGARVAHVARESVDPRHRLRNVAAM